MKKKKKGELDSGMAGALQYYPSTIITLRVEWTKDGRGEKYNPAKRGWGG